MVTLKFRREYKLMPFYSITLLLTLVKLVSPGANDLHFYDGVSTADVIYGDVFFEVLDPPELRYSYRIRPAKDFGAPFNDSIKFERARLVPTKPLHSCSDIVNYDDVVGQIALSERGECSFVHKTAIAQQAGARAIIITESIDKWDENLDHLIEMVDDKTEVDVNIPAAFLLGRSGATILRTLRKLNKSFAVVNLPINMTHVPIGKMNQPPWIAWPDTRRVRVYCGLGNTERLRCIQEVHPYSGSTVMVWAGIMKNKRTELVFVNGNMDAENYVEDILRPYIIHIHLQKLWLRFYVNA